MGDVMEQADPAIKNTLLKCMRQPATTLSVQLAAIQAFRRMTVTDEVCSIFPSEKNSISVTIFILKAFLLTNTFLLLFYPGSL